MWRLLARCLFFFGVCQGLCAAAMASPNYRALLVGVAQYPHLNASLQLQGPRNDVARMRDLLVSRGFAPQNITVLTDGVSGAELPTRERILAGLEELASTARAGDYIVLMMAGHGSQQPVPANSPWAAAEPDGLFEIFLPRDVTGWTNQSGGEEGEVRNAILDREIRAYVDRMTATGAFVWGIFDACHSATLVRGAGDAEVKLRQVTPGDLGIPQQVVDRAVNRASKGPATPLAPLQQSPMHSRGGSAFFYAAQTTQPTPELRLPAGDPDRKPYGLFSFTIMQALEGGGGMTYQQLAQQVLTRYGAMAEARATPLFSGTALHSGVLGQAVSSVRQWPLQHGEQLSIPAGALADVHEDAVFAILPSATAAAEAAIGHARVSKSSALSAVLVPTAFAGTAAVDPEVLKAGRVARLVRAVPRFDFVLSHDLSGCAQPCPFQVPLEALRSEGEKAIPGAQVRWVGAKETANLKLLAQGRQLWLAPPTMSVGALCTAGSAQAQQACMAEMHKSLVAVEAGAQATPEGIRDELRRVLHAASRAGNLMRVATMLSSSEAVADLQLSLARELPGGKRSALHPSQMAELQPGDKVWVALENTGRSALDVTLLYVDSKYGVGVMFPEPGGSNRLEAGARLAPFDIAITDSTLGVERLVAIVAQARDKGERADYSFLAQPSLSSETVTRGGSGSVEPIFLDAGFAAHASRGGVRSPAPASTGMQVFSWRVKGSTSKADEPTAAQ